MNLDELLLELQAELHQLGQFQLQGWLQLRDEQIHKKRDALGEESTFTHYDVESERRLLQFVHSRFPDHSFLGEETGHHQGDPEHYWIVDPIDGTTNFTHSIPFWGPSIAYWHRGQPQLAMVRFPALDRTYWARRGAGAFCNGEGGSGGALALAVGDVVLMLENAIYSVITPEGCAAILWKDSTKAEQAAEALRLTAPDLLELRVIDEVIPEPLGGAHRDPEETARRVQDAFLRHVRALIGMPKQELLDRRLEKYLKMGVYLEESAAAAGSGPAAPAPDAPPPPA
jgi:hypothetical protein